MFSRQSLFELSLSFLGIYWQTSHAGFQNSEKMNLERLKTEAFSNCQKKIEKPVILPVPILDPPNGDIEAIGMIYQEELAVRSQNLLDKNEFDFSPRPRTAVNIQPIKVFVDNDDSGTYLKKTWKDSRFDYSSTTIQPAIDPSKIPDAGRVLTEVVICHRSQTENTQLFDIRSSAYVRFPGFPPQVTGASLRLGAHRIDLSRNRDVGIFARDHISSPCEGNKVTENSFFKGNSQGCYFVNYLTKMTVEPAVV